jgi:hypothetical protein
LEVEDGEPAAGTLDYRKWQTRATGVGSTSASSAGSFAKGAEANPSQKRKPTLNPKLSQNSKPTLHQSHRQHGKDNPNSEVQP